MNVKSKSKSKLKWSQGGVKAEDKAKVKDKESLFSKALQDEFKNNQNRHSLTLGKSFQEGLLKIGDIFQSTGKAGIDILVETTYLRKLKDLKNLKTSSI